MYATKQIPTISGSNLQDFRDRLLLKASLHVAVDPGVIERLSPLLESQGQADELSPNRADKKQARGNRVARRECPVWTRMAD